MSWLQRTVLPKMDLQPRGDSPHRHAGPLIGMMCTWGSYVAPTRVCIMDITLVNNERHCISQLHSAVLQKVDLELHGDSPHRHAGRFIVILRTWGPCIALMRVCTMDIECLNKKGSSMSCYTGLYCQRWSCNSVETQRSPARDPSWDPEDLGLIYSSYTCIYCGYSVFEQ
jgi:hypothetical protein